MDAYKIQNALFLTISERDSGIIYAQYLPNAMAPNSWLSMLLHLYGVSALVVNPPQAIGTAALNLSLPQVPSSVQALTVETPQCDGNAYGHPGSHSCILALSRMPTGDDGFALFTIRQPRSPWAQYAVPSRVMSRESSDPDLQLIWLCFSLC